MMTVSISNGIKEKGAVLEYSHVSRSTVSTIILLKPKLDSELNGDGKVTSFGFLLMFLYLLHIRNISAIAAASILVNRQLHQSFRYPGNANSLARRRLAPLTTTSSQQSYL